jgi:hypothetical protein
VVDLRESLRLVDELRRLEVIYELEELAVMRLPVFLILNSLIGPFCPFASRLSFTNSSEVRSMFSPINEFCRSTKPQTRFSLRRPVGPIRVTEAAEE